MSKKKIEPIEEKDKYVVTLIIIMYQEQLNVINKSS